MRRVFSMKVPILRRLARILMFARTARSPRLPLMSLVEKDALQSKTTDDIMQRNMASFWEDLKQ